MGNSSIQLLYAENYLQYSNGDVEPLGTACGCNEGPANALYWNGRIIFHCDNSFVLENGTCEVNVPAAVLAFDSQVIMQLAAEELGADVMTVRCGTCDLDRVWVRWVRDERAIQIYCSKCNRNLTPLLPLASSSIAVS